MSAITLPAQDVRFITLPNGLEILVLEDHFAPVASVQAWVKTGSIHEGRWLGAGLSHLLEHMLFKGTPSRGPQEFARAVQGHGGYINAYTSFDRTVYWIDVPAPGVASSLELLADALMNSNLPADELVKEQEVIRREFAMGADDPDTVAGKQLFATAFAEHPLRHPVIGHLDVFNQLAHADLAGYHRSRYAPNNVFFVIAGAVDAGAVTAQLAAFFENHPRRALEDVLIPREPKQLGRREEHGEFDTELTRLGLAWHVPPVTHPDMPALDLLSVVLGGGRSSRFFRRLREEKGLVHSIGAWSYTPASAGIFGVDAMLEPGDRDEVVREILGGLGEIQAAGVREEELEKGRRQFLSHQLGALTTMRGKANDIGSNWLFARSTRFSHDFLDAAQRVTPADIQRVAREYFREENLTISSLNPRGSRSATIVKSAATSEGDTALFHLPNGLRLLVREDHRLPLVAIVSTFKAGLLAETAESNGITRLLARTLLKGTAARTAEDIATTIESAGGAIGSDSGNNSISVTARVLAPDLALGLELVGDVLKNAAFPEAAVAREKQIQLAGIKADEEEMTSVAARALRAALFGEHPLALHSLGTPESVAALTRERLVSFRDEFICGANGVVAVFGAVNAEEVRALAERTLGALPPGAAALSNLAAPVPPAVEKTVRVQKPKEQAVLMMGFAGVDFFSPDRAALELIDEACSDLGSRLFNRIREEMGLAYFVGSQSLPSLVPGAFTFYLGTDPAKLAEVEAALREEIATLAREGLTDEELTRAKAKLLGAQEIRNQSTDALAFSCALDELYGLGFAHYRGLRERVESLTTVDIQRVAAAYFEKAAVIAVAAP